MQLNFKKIGQGNPMLILHGVFGSLDNWANIGKKLSSHFSVYLIDQRNHGESQHSDEFTYKAMVEDLKDLMQRESIENPIMIGHSMGGKTVMNFAMKYPDAFDKMIVIDMAPKAYPPQHKDILKALNSISIKTIKTRKEADSQIAGLIHEFGVRQFLLKNMRRIENGFEWKINLPVITKSFENIYENIQNKHPISNPVLFIRGGNSNYILDRDIATITSLFPHSEVKTIVGAGHWVHVENPTALIEMILEFAHE